MRYSQCAICVVEGLCFDLVLLDILPKVVEVSRSRVALAVFPNAINVVRQIEGKVPEVMLHLPVEIRCEHQQRVSAGLRRVNDYPAREVDLPEDTYRRR